MSCDKFTVSISPNQRRFTTQVVDLAQRFTVNLSPLPAQFSALIEPSPTHFSVLLEPKVNKFSVSLHSGRPGPKGDTGETGPPGPSGGSYSIKEAPLGLVNGSNTEFYLSEIAEPNSELLFINGILQLNYYTIVGSVLTIDDPPEEGDTILITYKERTV